MFSECSILMEKEGAADTNVSVVNLNPMHINPLSDQDRLLSIVTKPSLENSATVLHQVRVLSSKSELRAVAQQWNRLSRGVAFRQFEWFDAWWRHYADNQQLVVLAVYESQTCVGLAPFFVKRVNPLGRVARLLGSGEVCSDHQAILADPRFAASVGEAVATWFANDALNANWDLIELSGLDPQDVATHRFAKTLRERGFAVHQESTISTWQIELPSDIETYLASLSKPCRRKVRTALKRFESGEYEVEFADSDEQLSKIWEAFVDLHQRRRVSLGEDGCFASERFTKFLLDAAKSFQSAGQLEFASVRLAGKPIATEICFRGQTTTYAYQIGIDPDALQENPGWLVNTASIARAIQQGQKAFDLCRGDASYKHHLGARATPCVECRLVPPRLRSQVWDAAIVSKSTLKQWCKAGLSMTGAR